MLNPKCPNCNYELILIERRLKYKCALCSKLYPQRYIENRQFRIWNKKQRELDIHNLKLSIKPKSRFRLSEKVKKRKVILSERRVFKNFRLLFKEKKIKRSPRSKLSEEERKLRRRAYQKRYYSQNKDKKILQNKLWQQENRGHYNKWYSEWQKKHRIEQAQRVRQHDKIQYWRKRQKLLALRRLENEQYKPSTTEIFPSVSTMLLAQLLRLPKTI